MLNPAAYDFASEFYIVEKTIEVVVSIRGESQSIRIEALNNPDSDPPSRYSTRAYIREDMTVQPTYPQSGGGQFDRKPTSVSVWVSYDLPWTSRDTADAALSQALGFLGDRAD